MIPKRIIWHHTASFSTTSIFDKINNAHRERGFSKSTLGYYVGYHYIIMPWGSVVKARRDTEIGMHDAGENVGSIGIALAGHFNFNKPTKAQGKAAGKLVAKLLKEYKIPATEIYPHRENDATDCPGILLKDNWLTIQYLKYRLNLLRRILEQFHEQ